MAPELIKGASYSFQLDWWTLGCLTYEMLVGKGPFSSEDMQEVRRTPRRPTPRRARRLRLTLAPGAAQLIRMIGNEEPIIPSHVSQEAGDWIRALMHKDPADRLGPPDALSLQADGSRASLLPREHPWQKGHVDWDALVRGEVAAPFLPCLLYTSPSPRDGLLSRMPSSA